MTRIEQIAAVSNKRAVRTKHAPVYTVDTCVFRTQCRPNAHSSYPQRQRLTLWITRLFYLVNMVSRELRYSRPAAFSAGAVIRGRLCHTSICSDISRASSISMPR